MWIGVDRVDYPFLEELPVFLLIFSLPAAATLIIGGSFYRAFSRREPAGTATGRKRRNTGKKRMEAFSEGVLAIIMVL